MTDALTMTLESRAIDAEKLVDKFLTEHNLSMENVGAFTINSAGRVDVYLNDNSIVCVGMVAPRDDEPEFAVPEN